jgi:hypothetical protein
MLAEAIKNISSKYLEAKNEPFANNELASFIRNSGKNILETNLVKFKDVFLLKGSPGQMNTWADVPWIAILDPEVTDSTQNGFLCSLFIFRRYEKSLFKFKSRNNVPL